MHWKRAFRRGSRVVALAIVAGCGAGACGQRPAVPVAGEIQTLARHAGCIFVGQIIQIQRRGSLVEVRFRVEQAVQGPVGAVFVLREWAGLWPPGAARYSAGQRVLAFVHGASVAGASSPVHGAEGLVPVLVQGRRAPEVLDVRRIAAAVVRAPGVPLPDATDGGVLLSDVLSLVRDRGRDRAAEPTRVPLPGQGQAATGCASGAGVPDAAPAGNAPVRCPPRHFHIVTESSRAAR